ncbi:DHH family phosphoesterase [Eubacteriales bacterium KG127]
MADEQSRLDTKLEINEYDKSNLEKIDENLNKTMPDAPFPMCKVDSKGKIEKANSFIDEVFLYDDLEQADFFALTGVKVDQLEEIAESNINTTLERNGKIFKVVANKEFCSGEVGYTVAFDDVTELEQLKIKYKQNLSCMAKVSIDNFDELHSRVSTEQKNNVSNTINSIITEWATSIKASLNKIQNDEFILFFPYIKLEETIESKFDILDKVRSVDTGADFPLSLSIGIGVGGSDMQETETLADSAMDLALGRGGDQAVIKTVEGTSYYGGKTLAREKSNKGKSRIIAHALKALIAQSNQIFIMGHRNADMDAFGSSLGVFRLCKLEDKDARIVISTVNKSLKDIYDSAVEKETYNFISGEKAIGQIEENALVIVVDTHRASYVDCPELLDRAKNVVVIDHHRRAEDFIKNATLHYLESYASSTAELVTEILQYSGEKKLLVKLEAEALLAGMTIDTNRFAVKTGVRTFEAASYLRRSGADTTEVKRFFQTDLDSFKIKSQCISDANFYEEGFAMSICHGENEDVQVINSTVADELLTIKGIKASFVAGRNQQGTTVISARSLGEINVQLIMEELGGGGHLTTAGAQSNDLSPDEILQRVKEIVLSEDY